VSLSEFILQLSKILISQKRAGIKEGARPNYFVCVCSLTFIHCKQLTNSFERNI
jgi:hypothetical protein